MPEKILIHTYTGRVIDLNNVQVSDIDIEDIAHSLSNTCRYTGHPKEYFSNAEHSVNVSLVCDPDIQIHGLLHDAAEYLVGDMHSPLKHSSEMKSYVDREKNKIMPVIAKAFKIDYTDEVSARIKTCDNRMLATEVGQLMNGKWNLKHEPYPKFKIKALSPLKAKQAFLNQYYKLINR